MKALYASDLHGRVNLYEEMIALASGSEVGVVILGGDLFPTVIPNPLSLIGGSADFQEDLKGQFRFVEGYLVPAMRAFLAAHQGVSLLYTPGNHDWIPVVKRFGELLPEGLNIHGQTVSFDDVSVFGYACVIDSTFWVKDYARRDLRDDAYVASRFAIVSDTDRLRASPDGEYALSEPSMEEELTGVSFEHPDRTICVFHSPPYDTGLDTLHNGRPIGSRAVRSFIERTGPLLSLHGHIHEAPYMSGVYRTRIGRTVSANPGYGPDALHALLFDTGDPAGTITHTLFGRNAPGGVLSERMPERRMRKVKAFFMETVLKGK